MQRACSGPQTQRGVVLVMVMVLALLAAILVVGGARTAWFSERLTGTEADHRRAFANAQAMLRDAEFAVHGEFAAPASPDGPSIPRQGSADYARLRARLAASQPPCADGICLPDALPPSFWKLPVDDLAPIKQSAARFALYSRAAVPADNPLLATRSWFWIEVLPFLGPFGTALSPDADNPYVFRITALAEGHRPGTQVVLQRLFVWKRADS